MKITIPKTVHVLDLADYDESFRGQTVDVWVNPPVAEYRKFYKSVLNASDLSKQIIDENDLEKRNGLIQTANGIESECEHYIASIVGWTDEEMSEFVAESVKTDPTLWSWMIAKVIQMISEHRHYAKKV